MRRRNGFTLVELMIAVIVVAILSAIAFPSYKQHLMRGYRNAGKQFLGHSKSPLCEGLPPASL